MDSNISVMSFGSLRRNAIINAGKLIFKNLIVENIHNYKSNSPDAYSFLCKVSFVVFVVIPSSKRKGSNMNPLLSEYTKTPSVVAADQDKPN